MCGLMPRMRRAFCYKSRASYYKNECRLSVECIACRYFGVWGWSLGWLWSVLYTKNTEYFQGPPASAFSPHLPWNLYVQRILNSYARHLVFIRGIRAASLSL